MWLPIFSLLLIFGQGAPAAFLPYQDDYDTIRSSDIAEYQSPVQLNEESESSKYQASGTDEQVFPLEKDFALLREVVEPFNEVHIEGDSLNKRFPGHLGHNVPGKFWVQSGECPSTPDGAREFFCPKPTPDGRWLCIDDHELCDGVKHCPNADDESPLVCMFYKAMLSQMGFLAQGITSHSMKSTHLNQVTK